MSLSFNRRYSAVKIILLNLFLFLLFVYVFPPFWESDDDFYISGIAAGIFGIPTPYTVFGNIILGQILCAMYSFLPSIHWYIVYVYALLIFSYLLISVVIARKLPGPFDCIFVLALFLITAPYFLIKINWTRVAALACAAGYLGMIDAIYGRRNGSAVWGSALMIGGALLRFNCWLMVSAVAVFPGLYFVISTLKDSDHCTVREMIRNLLSRVTLYASLLAVVVLIFTAEIINDKAYTDDPEWASYQRYNLVRSYLLDFEIPDYELYHEKYDALGLTANDVSMIGYWTFADPEIFDVETFEAIHQFRQDEVNTWPDIFSMLRESVDILCENVIFLVSGIFVVFMLLCSGLNYRFFSCILTTVMVGILVFYLVYQGRSIPRVVDGITVAYLVLTVPMVIQDLDSKALKNGLGMSIALCAMGILFNHSFYTDSDSYESKFSDKAELQTKRELVYEKLPKDNLYLMDTGTGVNYDELYTVFEAPERGIRENIVALGGWTTESPHVDRVLEKYRVDNPYRALYTRDDVFVVASTAYAIMRNVTHINEHYAEPVYWSVYDEFLGKYVVAIQQMIDGEYPQINVSMSVSANGFSAEDGFLWVEGQVGDAGFINQMGSYYIRLNSADGAAGCFRVDVKADGYFHTGIHESSLAPGEYTLELICREKGTDHFLWKSEAKYLFVDFAE